MSVGPGCGVGELSAVGRLGYSVRELSVYPQFIYLQSWLMAHSCSPRTFEVEAGEEVRASIM